MQTLIAGAGELGCKIASFLSKAGESVVVIDAEKPRCEWLSKNTDATVYNGSVLDPELLMTAGIGSTDTVVTVLESDEIALKFISFAKSQFGIPRIFAITKDSEIRNSMLQAGATKVISEEDEVLDEIENLFQSNGHRTLYFDRWDDLKISLAKIRATSRVLGKDADKVNAKESRIVAVVRNGRLEFPSNGVDLQMGDEIVIVGTSSSVEKLLDEVRGE